MSIARERRRARRRHSLPLQARERQLPYIAQPRGIGDLTAVEDEASILGVGRQGGPPAPSRVRVRGRDLPPSRPPAKRQLPEIVEGLARGIAPAEKQQAVTRSIVGAGYSCAGRRWLACWLDAVPVRAASQRKDPYIASQQTFHVTAEDDQTTVLWVKDGSVIGTPGRRKFHSVIAWRFS